MKLALRLLAKSRGFSAVAIVTLAVTIGVNAAIFSLIDGALLRPAVPHKPREVVCVFTGSQEAKRSFRQFSHAEFLALREPSVFADIAAVNFNYASLGREMALRVEFKTNLLAPARGEELIARGRVLRAGRTIAVCQADTMIFVDVETAVAVMIATMMTVSQSSGCSRLKTASHR